MAKGSARAARRVDASSFKFSQDLLLKRPPANFELGNGRCDRVSNLHGSYHSSNGCVRVEVPGPLDSPKIRSSCTSRSLRAATRGGVQGSRPRREHERHAGGSSCPRRGAAVSPRARVGPPRAGGMFEGKVSVARPAHILGGWSPSTPRFPKTHWEIVKIGTL